MTAQIDQPKRSDQLREDIRLINNVLEVRRTAYDLAIDTADSDLCVSAINNDDAGILKHFEGMLAEAIAEVEIASLAFESKATFEESMDTANHVSRLMETTRTTTFETSLPVRSVTVSLASPMACILSV